jgi:hypothetical protein
MLVAIDESGDAGMKLGAGSSRYFSVAAVVFPTAEAALACESVLMQLRTELSLKLDYEFHFTRCSERIRDAFYKRICEQDLCYYGFVIDKLRVSGADFKSPDDLYAFGIKFVCDAAREFFSDAKILIDEHGNREFKRRLRKSLKDSVRRTDGSTSIRDVTMVVSHEQSRSSCGYRLWCRVAQHHAPAVPALAYVAVRQRQGTTGADLAKMKKPADLSFRNADPEGHSWSSGHFHYQYGTNDWSRNQPYRSEAQT